MPSASALSIYVFGTTALAVGIHTLLSAETTTPEATANGLSAAAMGIYYPLAAYQENRAFFVATVPMRCLSAAVFWRLGWKAVAAWEGGGAALTGLAVAWETWRGGW